MTRRLTWLTGGTVLAVATFMATNGEGLFAGLKAGWLFLQLVTADMPMGIGAALLVLTAAVLSQAVLRRWLPHTKAYAKHWRTLVIELFALLLSITSMWLVGRDMMSLLLGTVDGLAAPFIYRAIAAGYCAARAIPSHKPPVP